MCRRCCRFGESILKVGGRADIETGASFVIPLTPTLSRRERGYTGSFRMWRMPMSRWRTVVWLGVKGCGLAAGVLALAVGAAVGQIRPGNPLQQLPPAGGAGDDATNREAAEGV